MILGQKLDKVQRKKLSKEEIDSIFVANSNVLPILNMLRAGEMDQNAINNTLERLKDEFDRKQKVEAENFPDDFAL